MAARMLADAAIALADALRSRPSSLSDRDLLAALDAAGEVRRLLDAVMVDLAGEVDRRSDGDDSLPRAMGERTGAALVSARSGLDPVESSAACAVAAAVGERFTLQGEALPAQCPSVAEALGSGRLCLSAALRIVRTLDEIERAAPHRVGDLEQTLVAAAPSLTGRELRMLCRRAVESCDPDGAEPREDLLRAQSGIRVVHQGDGLVRWIVTMHPEAAAFLGTAVDARTAPRRQPSFAGNDADGAVADLRTLPQRRLDALVDLARESVSHDSGRVAGSPVTVTVTVGIDALLTGIGSATLSGVDEPISAATARRLAADAGIIPAVLGSRSELLDLGRTVRIATPAQRRALEQRDGGCIWTGCNAPPGWCEVAHITPWWTGGATYLSNLVLLCPFHHRCFDHDGWTLRWKDGMPWLVPPPHIDASRRPRRAGRPRLVA